MTSFSLIYRYVIRLLIPVSLMTGKTQEQLHKRVKDSMLQLLVPTAPIL